MGDFLGVSMSRNLEIFVFPKPNKSPNKSLLIVDYVTAMEHLGRNFAIEFPFERHQEFFKDCNRVKRDKVLKKRLMSLKWKFNGKIESLVIHSSDIFFFLSRKKSSSSCTFSFPNIQMQQNPHSNLQEVSVIPQRFCW